MTNISIFNQENLQIQFVEDKEKQTLWATQDQICKLFCSSKTNISEHIKSILDNGELDKAVVRKFRTTATDGKNYQMLHFDLDMIIAIGYRVNSKKATEFRRWSTEVIRKFALDGFIIDPNRASSSEIAKQLRKLRVEEKEFYRMIKSVFKTTATDYDKDLPETRSFFSTIQDKFLYAVTGRVSAMLILCLLYTSPSPRD